MKIKTQEQEGQQGVAARPRQRSLRQAGAEGGLPRPRGLQAQGDRRGRCSLIKPGQVVVDLGAAPGAWSQYVRRKFAPRAPAAAVRRRASSMARIIALDLLRLEPIEGVHLPAGRLPRRSRAAQRWRQRWAGGRSTWWSRTWRPTCRASPVVGRGAGGAPGRTGGRLRAAPPAARRRAGLQGLPRQRLQPAGRAVQADVSGRQADQAQGLARPVGGNLSGRHRSQEAAQVRTCGGEAGPAPIACIGLRGDRRCGRTAVRALTSTRIDPICRGIRRGVPVVHVSLNWQKEPR